MKILSKLGLLVLGLVIVGGGCLSKPQPAEVTGDWWLNFDVPTEFHVYASYSKNIATPSTVPLTKKVTDVMIQNTELPIVMTGKPGKDQLSYKDKDYTLVRVFRYDVTLTKVPDEAKDLGNGWAEYTDDDGSKIYFFKGVHGIYRGFITVNGEGQDAELAKKILFSAQEVTKTE